MNDISVCSKMPPVTPETIAFARSVEAEALKQEQVHIDTEHVFHAGMYARTIMVPAGVLITNVEIKIPTILITSGDVLVSGGPDGFTRFAGHHVLEGQAGRKQVFYALADTWMTMLFPTNAKTVDAAEHEFTDEFDLLGSRRVVQ